MNSKSFIIAKSLIFNHIRNQWNVQKYLAISSWFSRFFSHSEYQIKKEGVSETVTKEQYIINFPPSGGVVRTLFQKKRKIDSENSLAWSEGFDEPIRFSTSVHTFPLIFLSKFSLPFFHPQAKHKYSMNNYI